MHSGTILERAGHSCPKRAARRQDSARRAPRAARRFLSNPLSDNSGSTLVEFSFIAVPFMLLLVGTLEVAMMFFTSAVMEGATKEAARQIRTGQIQASADPLAAFQAELCGSLAGVIDCSEVVFTVQSFSNFSSVSMPLEHDQDGEIINPGFAPGGSTAITVVRAVYRWDFMTPMMERVLPGGLTGHLLVSTVAFQNEPY